MQVAVISNLHLGPGDASDAFGHSDAAFLRFADFLERNFEQVILLGDIWETMTSACPGDLRGGFRAARGAHPEVARRFERKTYRYVHGNHDLVAGALGLAPEELVLDLHGTRFLFTHGHHHDLLFRKARWFVELGVWLGAWLQRLRMSALTWPFAKLESLACGPLANSARCTFQRWAIGAAELRSADVVVTGHTHYATRAEHGGRLFLNSGSCAGGQFSFLSLDTRAGRYEVNHAW